MPTIRQAMQYVPCEWSFTSAAHHGNQAGSVTLDVEFHGPAGLTLRVPAYWAGGREWRVRLTAPQPGLYHFRAFCSSPEDADLHGIEGEVEVRPYAGDNPLYQHGPLRISQNRRYLEHADGTPFFWLGDTWWLGLSQRIAWPDEFQRLVADRVAKGFSVIQIVAGLYPDMPAFDPRGHNEAGHPWQPDYAALNPAYFDMADLRLLWLVRQGLAPCIVGCWGYHLLWLGVEKMKQHWRNLVARYGAYPVIWCLAGEATMPYYLSQTKEEDRALLREGWTELARYVREIDPYHRPITIHPTDVGRAQVLDAAVLDLDMLQTGHGGHASIGNTVEMVRRQVACEPPMPVVEGEVSYEGIMAGSYEDVQHIIFWATFLSGAKGFTYGANGLWQLNREGDPFGPSPSGTAWGDLPWEEAYRLPGSTYIGRARRLLERYPWWRFESYPEWITPHAGPENYLAPYAAGIARQVRVIYFPKPLAPWRKDGATLNDLEPDVAYRAYLYDPKMDDSAELGTVQGAGTYEVPLMPVMKDWVLVLEAIGS